MKGTRNEKFKNESTLAQKFCPDPFTLARSRAYAEIFERRNHKEPCALGKSKRETRQASTEVKTEPSYFIYRLVSSQPGYAFEVSREVCPLERKGQREKESREKREDSAGVQTQAKVSSLWLSSAIERFGERRKNASIGCASVQQQQERASARACFLRDNPFFLVPSGRLSRGDVCNVRTVRFVRSFPLGSKQLRRSFSLSQRCVARASGPISSWTSHHSITLSMPVRPCLTRVYTVRVQPTRVSSYD